MLLKFITKFIRPFGLAFIYLFSFFCILGSFVVQEVEHTLIGKFLKFSTTVENRFYDYRAFDDIYKNRKINKFSDQISLVMIDDESLQRIGTWPIPRSTQAKMIDQLRNFGAKVIAMDIMYPEKSPTCNGYSQDIELADAIDRYQKNGGKLYLGYAIIESNKGVNNPRELNEAPMELYDDLISKIDNSLEMVPYSVDKFIYPIEELIKISPGMGFISQEEDSDAIFRRYHLINNINGDNFGSLALNAWRGFTKKSVVLKQRGSEINYLQVDDAKAFLDHKGMIRVKYIGNKEAFSTVSLADLLEAKIDNEIIRKKIQDKMVFIGSTATGAHDLRASPIDSKMPGVLSHMNMAQMLLDKNFFKIHSTSVGTSLFILTIGMLVFLFFQRFKNAFVDILVLAGTIVSIYLLDHFYFLPQGYELSLFFCYFCFTSCYSWNTFLEFWETSKEKKHIKGTFARYVAPTVVDEMLQDPSKLVVGGARKDITCLFSDVRDFTSISEGLSANELAQSLNMYMGEMTDIVFETKGTLDKYIGDAIVAFWGAPLEIGNHAEHAVSAAVRMVEKLPHINEIFKSLGRPEFKVGVGINSGECNVGNMGSSRIFSYTALGDNMNLGSRLEGLCKYYGTQILISESTLQRLNTEKYKFRPIDKVIVKGRTTPVSIFEVISSIHPFIQKEDTLSSYKAAYNLFEEKKFRQANNIFELILSNFPDDLPTQRLSKLCKLYEEHPEKVDDYFNITKMTEK